MLPKSLYRFVIDYSRRSQLLMLLVTTLSFPISYLTLELPKRIIDDAIGGSGFPRSFLGFELEQVEYLFALCFAFLFLFIASNGIKYVLNMLRGRTGERLLRRLRFLLIDRFMRLRRGDERHYTAGEVVQMVAAEVQPLGNFAGDFFATPVMQTGTLIVLLGFIFVQDPVLGLAAVALLPVQAIVIPQLQRRVVKLTRQRIKSVRHMSDEIGENVAGLETVRSFDVRRWRLAILSDRLYENFELRLAIFNQKFLIKFVNNVINQITPFAFYSVGGYFVIEGQIEIGALVAVIAAHKDLQAPWKELLRYYQDFSDISSRYEALVERFGLGETERDTGEAPEPTGPASLTFSGVAFDDGVALEGPNSLTAGSLARISGGDENKRSAAVAALIGLQPPKRGRIQLDGAALQDMTTGQRAGRIAFVTRSPDFFRATLRENLALSLAKPADVEVSDRRSFEASASGNPIVGPADSWIDPTLVGLADQDALDARLLEMASELGVFDPIFFAGLGGVIDPSSRPEFAEKALEMRAALRTKDADSGGLVDVVEFWSEDSFNENASLIENLLFAAPADGPQGPRELVDDRELRRALSGTPLEATLLSLGADAIEATADLLEAVGAASNALRDFDLYPPDLVVEYRLAATIQKRGSRLSAANRKRLLEVAFGLTPARHRLGLLTEEIAETIVKARDDFSDLQGFQHFDAEALLPGLSLRENLLLGRPRLSRRERWPRIGARLRTLAAEHGVEMEIAKFGLDADIKGRDVQLSPDNSVRFALIRALLGQPRLLALDGPGGGGSAADEALLSAIKALKGDAIMIYTSSAESECRDGEEVLRLTGAPEKADV